MNSEALLNKLSREKWKVARLETIIETKTRDLYRANRKLEGNLSQLKHTQELEAELTTSRHAQELMHADRLASIGQLAAGVAHEINNPATFVLANIGFLAEIATQMRKILICADERPGKSLTTSSRSLPCDAITLLDEMEEMLGESLHGMERICATTKELLPFSRVEPESLGDVDINEVVTIAIKIVSTEIRHRADISTNLGQVSRTLVGDRGKLCQVLVNLLINASHAMKDGPLSENKITVETKMAEGCLILSVSDTGCGISAEQQKRIFEPFFTTKPQEYGTGLGLALSAEIIRKHGGTIKVASETGEGSTFIISLPYENPFSASVSPNESVTEIKQAPDAVETKRARILIVDDEPLIRKALWRMLRSHHDVVQAGNGKEALAFLGKDHEFDVILCDIMMPDIDGPAVYNWVCENAPSLAPRMIFISGGVVTDRATDFVKTADVMIVDKPISSPDLLAAIAQITEL